MADTNKEEFPPLLFPEPKPYGFYEETLQARSLHFYISGPIEEPERYVEMIHKIRMAGPNDQIHIHLNTPGGQVDTGVQIINAIDNCFGTVYTHLDGSACSMGALLFLAGHQMIAYEHSLMMFHNYSGGITGKGHELKAMLDAQEVWYDKIQDKILIPFLTKSELNRIKKGEDIWMQHDEIERRLEKVHKAAAKRVADTTTELS